MRSITVAEVEKAIKLPAKKWAGQCYGVATEMVKKGVVDGRAVYGIWWGLIHPKSLFAGRAWTHHGWIVLYDHSVIDPTRWVFEHAKPYIYHGPAACGCLDYESEDGDDYTYLCICGHTEDEHASGGFFNRCLIGSEYDEGGNRLREELETPCPEFKVDKAQKFQGNPQVLKLVLPKDAAQYVSMLTTRPVEQYTDEEELHFAASPYYIELTVPQVFWLANLSLNRLGGYAAEIYAAIQTRSFSGFIPIDNRLSILGA